MIEFSLVDNFLYNKIFDHTILSYFITAGIFVGTIVVILILHNIILRKIKKQALKTKGKLDDFIIDLLDKNIFPLLYYGAFFISAYSLDPGEYAKKVLNVIGIVLLSLVIIRFVIEVLDHVLKEYWAKKVDEEERVRNLKRILSALKFFIWGLGVIFFLANLGFDISAIVAGLGISGIAVALAAQAVLADLFSYFSILFDRPFEIGNFIIVDNYMGAVEHIGIKTTRIRSLGGEQLVFSNTDLTGSRVRNYKRMQKRRVVFSFGVTYDTPTEKLKKIPSIVENIIKEEKEIVFDRAHFMKYSDSSLDFEVVYNVLSGDYNLYMDIQQAINFKIKEAFEADGIEFAFPTRTVYINNSSAL